MASARLAVLALFVVGCQCWKLPAIPEGRRAQYYTQQSDGAYKYGYDTSEGLFQVQEGDSVNEVQGKFGAEGGETQYTAGVGGFVVTGHKKATASGAATKTYSAAPVRYATLEELTTHPKQVTDTAEVAAAKAKFQADYAAAAAAAEAAPDVDIITGAVPVVVKAVPYVDDGLRYSGPLASIDAEGNVLETAEVKAAKATFHATYNAAAAAAAAAPDVNIFPAPAAAPAPAALYTVPAVVAPAPAVITVDAHGNVQDTPEVAAAKAQFKATYDAAAALAEAAPDVNIITAPAPAPAAIYFAPAPAALYSAPAITVQAQVAPAAPAVKISKPVEIAHVRSSAKEDGSYEFSYETSDSSRHEAADAANNVRGNFEFVADDAHRRRVDYSAGADTGFIASGAHLPVSVADTAEVRAAKASFKSAFAAAAAAAEAAPDDPIDYSTAPVAVAPQAAVYVAAQPVVTTTYVGAKTGEIADFRSTANTDGSYEFSYTTSDSSRHEAADAANNVHGNFEFVADDAHRRRVDYSAGADTGFIASGAHLPVSVADTAEVKAAKASFKSAFAAAAVAAEAAPDVDAPVSSAVYSAPFTSTVVAVKPVVRYATLEELRTLPKPVADTPEVAAAKAQFKADYAAAAAAAEAAPDVNIITGPAPAPVAALYVAPAAPAPVALPVVTLDASGKVEDTAEVKAAKEAFRRAYSAQAAAAAAAPDVGIITAPAAAAKAAVSAATSHHGNMRTYSFDGITVMEADGALSPAKYGYSYE